MDKKHRKRGNKAFTRSHTLIYTRSWKRIQGERNRQRELSLMLKGDRKKKCRRERSK
jgi:hypothetical protein